MKKLLSLFLALAMLACFAGAAVAEDLTIGVNIQEFSNAYPTEMRNGMEETADELGITLGARAVRVRVVSVQETVAKNDAALLYQMLE